MIGTRFFAKLSSFAALLCGLLFSTGPAAMPTQECNFKVYLDDSEIGFNNFQIEPSKNGNWLRSEARFKVKVLFFDAYTYAHSNTELWEGGCLKRIAARTDDNGDKYRVHGEHNGKSCVVATSAGRLELPSCVRTFAYWDPDILNVPRLLNARTGEYVEVTVTLLGEQGITIDGKLIPAKYVRLQAAEQQFDLWCSRDNQWLALQSTREGGRVIRYLRQ